MSYNETSQESSSEKAAFSFKVSESFLKTLVSYEEKALVDVK